jgi:hypothetical protein
VRIQFLDMISCLCYYLFCTRNTRKQYFRRSYHMKRYISGILVIAFLIVLSITAAFAKEQNVKASFMKAPLSFIKNDGQKNPSILYYEQGTGHITAFTKEGISVSLTRFSKIKGKNHSNEVVTLTPLSTSPFSIEALDTKEGKINYLMGNDPNKWKTDIPTYGAVLYKNIYPGIDMKFYGTNSQLEYDIIVSPHADPSKVLISYKGIEKLSLSPTGDLEISLKEGSLLQKKPHIYQTINGTRKEIEGKFILAGTTYGFVVGSYDKSHPLIIDPVLVYSTYLGGSDRDEIWAIAVDQSGNAYVVGRTWSTNFPTTLNSYQGSFGGSLDGFITKLNATGNGLVYSTYLGGSGGGGDAVTGIAIDASGIAYLAGHTYSVDFPIMNPYQGSYGGSGDVFVAKLNATGNGLVYSTYLGGSGDDAAYAIAVDQSGNAYVVGRTPSVDFPTLNPYQLSNAGSLDGFVAKLNATGDSLVYSTYLGGSGDERAYAISVDGSDNAYVVGETLSADFPTLNPYQLSNAGGRDGFVAKLNATGDSLVYSTYLGGSGDDAAHAIAVDGSDNAYVVGHTESTNFPTLNPYQLSNAGGRDAFVTKLDPSGSLVYSTYLGGNSYDYASAIAVDGSGQAYVAGYTGSIDFPTLNTTYQGPAGGGDAFVTKLSPSGSLVYSIFLGGNDWDMASAIAIDDSGHAYVAGYTLSTNFPTLNPYQGSNSGSYDTFVVKLSADSNILYKLIAQKTGTGSIIGTGISCGTYCTEYYEAGTLVTLTATPDSGSSFSKWVGCDSVSGNACTVIMTTNKSVSATFTLNRHTLTVGKSGTGSGTVTGTGITCGADCTEIYDYGTVVALTATANTGSTFTEWTGCDSTSNNLCTVSMTGNKSVSATFTLNNYTITAAKSGSGLGTLSAPGLSCIGNICSGTYGFGTTITVTASTDAESHFNGWSGCDSVNNNLCIVSVTGNKLITATFTLNSYTLAASKAGSGSGSLTGPGLNCTGNSCTGTYDYNTTVNVTATASAGSVFAGWTGCDSVVENVCTVLINGDKNVTATFYLEYSLLIDITGTGDGRVTSIPSGIDCEPTCSDTFPVDTIISLTARPYTGSVFAYWSGACTGSSTTCEITMTGYKEVFAHFVSDETKKYRLTVGKKSINKGNGLVVSDDGTISCGDICMGLYYPNAPITLRVTSSPGSLFEGWAPASLHCGTTPTCSFTMDTKYNVKAIFRGPYRLLTKIKSKNNGSGSVTADINGIGTGINCPSIGCEDYYQYGTSVVMTAQPGGGSQFIGWKPSSLGCGTSLTCTVPITKKWSVIATFGGM